MLLVLNKYTCDDIKMTKNLINIQIFRVTIRTSFTTLLVLLSYLFFICQTEKIRLFIIAKGLHIICIITFSTKNSKKLAFFMKF